MSWILTTQTVCSILFTGRHRRSMLDNSICDGMLLTSPRITISAISALAYISSTSASSFISAATPTFSRHIGVSVEVGSLASTLHLVEYGIGPALLAPLIELRGRKLPSAPGDSACSGFAVAVAISKDIQTRQFSRFFMGLFGSASLVVVAVLAACMPRSHLVPSDTDRGSYSNTIYAILQALSRSSSLYTRA